MYNITRTMRILEQYPMDFAPMDSFLNNARVSAGNAFRQGYVSAEALAEFLFEIADL